MHLRQGGGHPFFLNVVKGVGPGRGNRPNQGAQRNPRPERRGRIHQGKRKRIFLRHIQNREHLADFLRKAVKSFQTPDKSAMDGNPVPPVGTVLQLNEVLNELSQLP